MGLKEQLAEDLKAAMRSGDALRRDVLRSAITAINNAEIASVDIANEGATRQALGEDAVIDVLRKQVKQRRDSAGEYRKANRADLAEREESEIAVLEEYLPQQLSRDEIAAEVRQVIAETGASGPGDKSKVMPAAMQRLKGRADGRVINEVATELLSQL
jgi:uncharacterized protein YqeY